MRDELPALRAAGAELVVVGSGSPAFASAFRDDERLDCPVLVDTELRAFRAAGFRRGHVEVVSARMLAHAHVRDPRRGAPSLAGSWAGDGGSPAVGM